MLIGVQEGTIFAGRYRVVRLVGAGAMGAVYEVVHLGTDRRCALKVMHAHIVTRAELRERFEREAKVAARVDSEFIVDVIDAGVDEPTATPFFTMELLRGEDLSRRLKRLGRRPPDEVVQQLHQAARALDRTHAAGIVHRDLKPSNLFLSERDGFEPQVKVLDFGVAKLVAEGATASSMTATAGTPIYMAPEQFRGSVVSAASDIHALGMIAYTLLVGESYWAAEASRHGANMVGFALVAIGGPHESARARAARNTVDLPELFDAWFARATAVIPGRRFTTASAAVRALAAALGVPAPSGDPGWNGEDGAPLDADRTGSPDEADREGTEAAQDLASPSVLVSPVGLTLSLRSGVAGDLRRVPTARERAASARRWRWLGAIALIAVLAAGARTWLRPAEPPHDQRSPLAPPDSVLACPILEASGVDGPRGWLGAAAAAIVCERARVILGGAPWRTLVPAELLGLPNQPMDDYPVDPYGQPDARARSLEVAQRRASAVVDGKVVREPSGFRVELILRRADGSELGRSTGAGRALYQAVRAAMDPLARPELMTPAPALDPVIAAWSQARDPESALAAVDLTLAFANNAGGLADECDRVKAHGRGLSDLLRVGLQHQCAYARGMPMPATELPPAEPGSAASFVTRARLQRVIANIDEPPAVTAIEQLYETEVNAWARSVLASTASCLLQSSNNQRAVQLAFLAIQAEPKNPTGEYCAPWGQLLSLTVETASGGSVVRAMQAWAPWDANAWVYQTRIPDDPATALGYARRAWVLSPFDMDIAGIFADRLLAAGAREEARGLAVALSGGGLPIGRVEGELLLVRVDASEARFAAAFARAQRAMEITGADVGWVRVQRLEIAWRAVELANLQGRAAEVADRVVERFLDPEPPPLDGLNITVAMRIPAICARASAPVARRCFARFRELQARLLSGGIIPETSDFTDGAERYSRADFHGAARAWRPLLRNPGLFAALLPDAMEATFERTGETELVDRLEADSLKGSDMFNGASPAMARAARRAFARGDRERARSLAKRVVEAWSVADETPPVVDEMRKLVAETR